MLSRVQILIMNVLGRYANQEAQTFISYCNPAAVPSITTTSQGAVFMQ